VKPVVRCESCGYVFEADKKLTGGYANCPQCRRATPVEGLRDPLWRLWQVGVLVVVLIVSGLVWRGLGPAPAAGVFFGGLALSWLISRAF